MELYCTIQLSQSSLRAFDLSLLHRSFKAIKAPRSPCAHLLPGLVSTGSDIYNIGHKFSNKGTSRVSILDCRSHTWREAPSMTVEQSNPAVNVVDGKIYVAGGCRDDTKWMEVFDPKTQAWEVVSRPGGGGENWGFHVSKSAAFDEKVYMFGNRNDSLAYKPKEGTLENVGWNVELN
ncbi:hypothetical protein AALP_AAs46347U000100 [Arabis alpina]|uniref:FKB95-like N-terminal Kelch domain-containing protein n=1 Tax=Arabis alpina TaxID=50452 RepID=A0A087FWP3_ARAAL|nr:hypothetical protein AALP_AAs46347U000100 [Arabis alpina]